MCIIDWATSQIASYGVLPWLAFVAITALAAYLLRTPGVLLGHLLVTAMVVVLDVRWIQAQMSKPGWNGQPDQDFVFLLGVAARIVLVNTVLFPVSALALRMRHRGPRRRFDL
jgi:hypothetical protein